MNKSHIGIDIVEIDRIRNSIERWGDLFLKRVYTDSELSLYSGKLSSLAARFAGKEAAFKALGGAGFGMSWQDIEIMSQSGGKPFIRLSGKAREKADDLGLTGLDISLSHSRDYGIALVIGFREE